MEDIGELGQSNVGKLGHYGRVGSWSRGMGHGPTLPQGEMGHYVRELGHATRICFIHDYSD